MAIGKLSLDFLTITPIIKQFESSPTQQTVIKGAAKDVGNFVLVGNDDDGISVTIFSNSV